MSGSQPPKGRKRSRQRVLPTNLDQLIERHEDGMAVLMNAGIRKEQIVEFLRKIQITFYFPVPDDFFLPSGMTRTTWKGFIQRLDDLAAALGKLNSDPTYGLAQLSRYLNEGAKKLMGDVPLERYLSDVPFRLHFHATLLKKHMKTVGRIRMGPGRGHFPRKTCLKTLFAQIKQPLEARHYRSVGQLLDALVPENQGIIPDFDESRLQKLHRATL